VIEMEEEEDEIDFRIEMEEHEEQIDFWNEMEEEIEDIDFWIEMVDEAEGFAFLFISGFAVSVLWKKKTKRNKRKENQEQKMCSLFNRSLFGEGSSIKYKSSSSLNSSESSFPGDSWTATVGWTFSFNSSLFFEKKSVGVRGVKKVN
jgi:hypothetical protein